MLRSPVAEVLRVQGQKSARARRHGTLPRLRPRAGGWHAPCLWRSLPTPTPGNRLHTAGSNHPQRVPTEIVVIAAAAAHHPAVRVRKCSHLRSWRVRARLLLRRAASLPGTAPTGGWSRQARGPRALSTRPARDRSRLRGTPRAHSPWARSRSAPGDPSRLILRAAAPPGTPRATGLGRARRSSPRQRRFEDRVGPSGRGSSPRLVTRAPPVGRPHRG
mmetsp:Transcript_53547/g.73148  ORF Transcript_53547/g.73148 Transcript_53547/m.73148 type:complete len:218 (+) Transcript_53547:384-1037(+)